MTSIPADPGIVLGNIIQPWRVIQLQAIAKLQNPVDLANDRLNNLITSNYKLRMIYHQMVNMNIDLKSLAKLEAEMAVMKHEMANAAIDLGNQTMIAEKAIRIMKAKLFSRTKISKEVESPIDYKLSQVEKFPLSFDSLKFDVQFFQVQKSADSSTAHATSISAYVGASYSASGQPSMGAEAAASAHATTMSQVTTNALDSTIVITAFATHKQVDIMNPFVMDAEKAVNAWNYCRPLDRLRTNPVEMWRAALLDNPLRFGTINLLSGVAKSSSFVGYIHILKTERTAQTQNTATVAASVAASIENNMGVAAMTGKFGASTQVSSTVNALLSTSRLINNCSLQSQGCIPSIVSNPMETMVQNMNPDPATVMNQLGAIAGASSTAINTGMEMSATDASTGSKFMELQNSYITNAVQALGEESRMQNKVIDANSMMTAFEDYVKKAMAGDAGVPTAYFMKEITKSDIAKIYIRRFYPHGAKNQKDAQAGQLGMTPEGGGST
mmetsp:Transcript_14923/g.21991  ORF Transcript_14923/g.21991 Transcript_14923/m.21991 type:complete len:498 (-) Transcript_14923:36-1529(-)|eukprot:CAMPEP_0194255024 /NCGR_PEP_ID=MMETSP0158-20130606/33432_1 /TAXON_ID=33649 /ORGANISM="Thalassionema nitzschioides, Strain L26-B" /LENGTH=497 /DNA_ID=CAMNT_0038993257 /DNA_START=96 /DNA_END=1585 /DNA_ORIENTATION=+